MDSVFEELYEKYHHDIFNFLFYMVRNREQAEDLVQEVYIKVLRSYKRFKGESSEKTWLLSIARHVAIDFFRKQKSRRRKISGNLDWDEEQLCDVQPLPEEIAIQKEEIQLLYRCLERCTIDQQLVIVLRFIQSLSITETAEALGWTESKVKTTQHRALKVLKKYMEEEMEKGGSSVKKFRWNDECLEHALQQMPMIKDHRSKEEIYQQLIEARKTARRKSWFLPSLISVVAVMLVTAIYAPSLPLTQHSEKRTEKLDQHMITLQAKQPAKESQTLLSAEERDSSLSRIVTKEALNDQDIAVVGVPDQQSHIIIPISVPVKKYEPAAEQLEMATSKIDEQKWGVSKRLLDGVTIAPSRESKVWLVRVPKQHPIFSEGSTSESMFLASIEETIRWMGGKKVCFFTEKKEGMALHHIGYVKALEIPHKKRVYYLYRPGPTHPVFLVPSPQHVPTFLEALKQMKKDGDGPLRSTVPKGVHIKKVSMQHDNVVIEFTEDSKLNELPSIQWMMEAILLTAKEFGFHTVTFKGGGVKRIGPYMFEKKIAVPVGPNPIMVYASAR